MVPRMMTAVLILVLSFLSPLFLDQALGEDINGIHGKYTGENNDVIDMYTGTLNIYQNDLTLPGINGLDVVIGRTYSSDVLYDDLTTQNGQPHWGLPKPFEYLGRGWHWHLPRIYNDTIYYGDGSSEGLFLDYPADYLGRKKTRQYSLILVHSDSSTYDSLFGLDGTIMIFGPKYHFNSGSDPSYAGKFVKKIVNPHGDYITITYWGNYPFVKKITDSIGRDIWFEYSSDSASFGLSTKLTKIKYFNWDADTISVNYYYSGNNLVKVKYPSGDSILYSYAEYYVDGKLSEIVEPYGGRIRYTWGAYPQWRYSETHLVESPDSTFHNICDLDHDLPFCMQNFGYCPCTTITTTYVPQTTNFYNWQCNVISRKRVYLNDTADSIRFSYGYPESYCWGSTTEVTFPDSSMQRFYHAGYKYPEEVYGCIYNGGENILYEVITYENYRDSLFERRWFAGEAPNGPNDEFINTVRIGTTSGGDSVTVPVVRRSGVNYHGTNYGCEFSTYSSFDSFDPHTGTFGETCNNGVSIYNEGYRDTVSNRYFPIYRKTIDSTGTYVDSSKVRLVWDYANSELDAVRKYYGSDSLVTTFAYDSHGNKTSSTDPQGNTIYYEYSANYNSAFLTRMYSTAFNVDFIKSRYYFYSGAESLQVSPNLDATLYTYDTANRLTYTKRPLEPTSWSTQKSYQDEDRQITESVRLNDSENYGIISTFNEFNWPVAMRNQDNFDWIYTEIGYDNMGRISRTARPHKAAGDTCWTKIFYDGMGRAIKTLYPDGSRDSTIYASALTTETVDKLGRRKKTILDDHFRLSKAFSDSLYRDSTTFQYGPWGKVVRETDARGLIKKYWYDKYGRLYSDSSDDGQKFYFYDKGNNLRFTRESPSDTIWKYIKYDGLGRQLELGTVIRPDTTQVNNATYPSNGTVLVGYKYDDYSAGFKPLTDSTHYNSKMNLTEVTDQSGKTWLYYDNRNRLWRKKQFISGLADTVDIYYNYDRGDRLVKITYPDSSEVDYDYYKNGWLESIPGFVEKPDAPGAAYKPWGAVTSMTFFDDTSYVDAYSYDTTTTRLTKVFSRKGGTKFWGQTYEYDLPGNITKNFGLNSNGTPNNNDTLGIHTYDYTYLLKQSRVKSTAAASTLKYWYDDNGNRTREIVDSDTTNYYYPCLYDTLCTYDSIIAQVSTACEEEIPVNDDSTAFTPATLDTVFWSSTAIAGCNLNFKIWSADSIYVNTPHIYSSFFIPTSLIPIHLKVTCNYHAGNCSASMKALYHADSTLTNNVSNKIGRLSGQGPNNYVYDNAGRLIEDVAAGKEYVYNALGQLVKYKKDGNDRIFFTYDYSGHLVKKTILRGNLCDRPDSSNSGAVCTLWPQDSCSVNDPNSGYVAGDANGNGYFNGIDCQFLTAWIQGLHPDTALHDPRSRADANCSGSVNGIDVTYMVNYFKGGQMVYCCFWDSSYEVSTYYIYSGDQVVAEYNNSGTLDWNYVYGLGQRLAKYKNSEKWAYHNDHLGNVRAVTNVGGSTVNKADYYPYGERLFTYGDVGKYSYNGKEYVDDWGFDLYYYGARFMDPNTGRFITPDPIQDYLNQYSYVGNNPVNRIDPTGMAGIHSAVYHMLDMPSGFGDYEWVATALLSMQKTEAELIAWSERKEQLKREKEREKEEKRLKEEAEKDPNALRKYALYQVIMAGTLQEKAYWMSVLLANPDFIAFGGSGGFAYIGGEGALTVDRWLQGYGTLALAGGPSSPFGVQVMYGYFVGKDVTSEQAYNFFTGPTAGITAAGGPCYEVGISLNAVSTNNLRGYQAFGIGGLGLSVYGGYTFELWR